MVFEKKKQCKGILPYNNHSGECCRRSHFGVGNDLELQDAILMNLCDSFAQMLYMTLMLKAQCDSDAKSFM